MESSKLPPPARFSTMWRTILVPHDFSACADHAATIACDAAKAHQGKVLLLHVVELPPHFGPDSTLVLGKGSETPMGIRQFAETAAASHLDELAAKLRTHGVEVSAFVRVGRAIDEIDRFVGEHAVGVIVMGTHGRTGLRHLMAGSVAERVVRTSPVPVVTVRGSE
ncbi:MAG: UspA domain protein [Deltaproteobacteria bacterium]|nr:UspA domain protein [Deltaproteobacteria bacterium]